MAVTDRELSLEHRSTIVFHADDLGMSDAVDRGIVRAFTDGVLTSTSVLANGPTAAKGIAAVRAIAPSERHADLPSAQHRRELHDEPASFDLGGHFNLTQGQPLTGDRYPRELLDDRGCFLGPGRLLAATMRWREPFDAAVRDELNEQIAFIRDHGVEPTHANGHQYVEMFPRIGPIVVDVVAKNSIPVVRWAHERHLTATTLRSRGPSAWLVAQIKRQFARKIFPRLQASHLAHPDEYFGTAHAGHITLPVLSAWLDRVAGNRSLEIGIHPACAADETSPSLGWSDPLAALRPSELAMLCSDSLVAALRERRLRLGRLSSLRSDR
jgi:predicted glycoside hydrolase/deacetylase ChbG (UPF0249 family)